MNFTDVRKQVNVTSGAQLIQNETLTKKSYDTLMTGDNIIYNDTATREIHVVFTGKNSSRNSVKMVGSRCIGPCLPPPAPTLPPVIYENRVRRWCDE